VAVATETAAATTLVNNNCNGCAEAREHLLATKDRNGHRHPRAWLRCDVPECGRIVALDERGLQSALDATERAEERAKERLRREAMLDELDNLARWRPYLEGKSSEPSPIVGDGNVGGGAKLSTTDRPDYVNKAHDEGDDLDRAQRTRLRLGKLSAAARIDERRRHRDRDPVPTSFERGVAVLWWLVERSGVPHMPRTTANTKATPRDRGKARGDRWRRVVYRLGMDFGGRAIVAERTRLLGDLIRRRRTPELTVEAIRERRAAISAELRGDLEHIAKERRRIARTTRKNLAAFGRASVLLGCQHATAAAKERHQRALEALEVDVRASAARLTSEQFRAEQAKLPREPTEDAVRALGQELLELAARAWLRGG
jgi:hypothetical protein